MQVNYLTPTLQDFLSESGLNILPLISQAQLLAEVRDDPMLQECQFWVLKMNSDGGVTLTCERDTDDVIKSFYLSGVDISKVFHTPKDRIVLYLSDNTLCFVEER